MSTKLRWGILGTGKIATKFADELPSSQRCQLVAVGSRSPRKAAEFAEVRACASSNYDDLLGNSDVDAVYVSLPNSLHAPWSIRALQAIAKGKKPEQLQLYLDGLALAGVPE